MVEVGNVGYRRLPNCFNKCHYDDEGRGFSFDITVVLACKTACIYITIMTVEQSNF